MVRHSTAEIFGRNVEESLTLFEQEDLEYSLKKILNESVGKVLHQQMIITKPQYKTFTQYALTAYFIFNID